MRAGALDVRITRDRDELLSAKAVVLPGVGHFGHCARELARFGLDSVVRSVRDRKTPLLGLCVGMQLFFEGSEEDESVSGLGLVRGVVRRLRGDVRVPHTGWDEIHITAAHPWLGDAADGAHFYFVHSYAPTADADGVVATTDYGDGFGAIVGGDGFLGFQFHPEKSSLMGTRLLHSFVRAVS